MLFEEFLYNKIAVCGVVGLFKLCSILFLSSGGISSGGSNNFCWSIDDLVIINDLAYITVTMNIVVLYAHIVML